MRLRFIIVQQSLYNCVFELKINELKGAACYYYWIFYERTHYKKVYIDLKKQHKYADEKEWLLAHASKYAFWLAEYVQK